MDLSISTWKNLVLIVAIATEKDKIKGHELKLNLIHSVLVYSFVTSILYEY